MRVQQRMLQMVIMPTAKQLLLVMLHLVVVQQMAHQMDCKQQQLVSLQCLTHPGQ
jgi:hypothetical protein